MPFDTEIQIDEIDARRREYMHDLLVWEDVAFDPDDYPPELEGITWERIEYPEGASFVNDRTPEDEVPF